MIYNADCLEKMPDIADKSIDMILCDLPYGITYNKWDSVIPLDKLWAEYLRIIKPSGAIVLTAAGLFTAKLILSQEKLFKYKWVWEKQQGTGHLNAKKQPMRKHEDICVFYQKQPTYNPQMLQGFIYYKTKSGRTSSNYRAQISVGSVSKGERYPMDIIQFKSDRGLHPTQKPLELGRYLVRTYTNPGDLVLDNACGSGTFCLAAALEGREYIGIEKNAKYAKIANERLKNGHF